jgi:glucosyl-dolichyl phosphate glucuronosyltransferase
MASDLVDSSNGGHADASVIICAYTLDRWDDLLNAVRSVGEQTVRPRETTVVVDNNPELLAQAGSRLSDVRVLPNDQAPGLCGARNTGASWSSGSVLVFLDDDAVACREWLEQHLLAYSDPSVLGVGGRVTPIWRSEPPGWLAPELYWVVGCSYTGLPVKPAAIRNPIGANMSMRADVYARAGGFEADLGRLDVGGRAVTGSADETEFCIRASQHFPDGRWVYRPDASIQHVVTPSRATWRYFVERCQLEGGSKAVLVGLRGGRSGLSSERRYVTRVLPRGFLRELLAAVRGEADGLRRAGAIAAGLAITGATYLRARSELRLGRGRRYSS